MKKLLITGVMRSGTTLLANYLQAQEGMIVLRDQLVALFRTSKLLGIRFFGQELTGREKRVVLTNLKAQSLLFGLREINRISLNSFTTLNELFEACAGLSEKEISLFGVKVTEAEDWVEDLLRNNYFVVYLIRDLRDVLLSQKNMFVDYDRMRVAKKWKEKTSKILSLKGKYSKLIIIRFEDLVLEKNDSLFQLSFFLGKIEYNKKTLVDVTGVPWISNSSYHDIKSLFDPVSVNRWKRCLEEKEVVYGSVVNRKLMKELNYEENFVPFGKRLRILFEYYFPFFKARRRIRWVIKRLVKK